MKTLQLEAHKFDNDSLLKTAGVKRIHPGWYSIAFRGVALDSSTICAAHRNRGGEIKQQHEVACKF